MKLSSKFLLFHLYYYLYYHFLNLKIYYNVKEQEISPALRCL
nr:MAG TPA: hypothetical protein [Caudoviricetes sp.]DAW98190.1 MAG TPA: hypothetical protein [Bacteriophage sp.]